VDAFRFAIIFAVTTRRRGRDRYRTLGNSSHGGSWRLLGQERRIEAAASRDLRYTQPIVPIQCYCFTFNVISTHLSLRAPAASRPLDPTVR
jgi:hypothetical protein